MIQIVPKWRVLVLSGVRTVAEFSIYDEHLSNVLPLVSRLHFDVPFGKEAMPITCVKIERVMEPEVDSAFYTSGPNMTGHGP